MSFIVFHRSPRDLGIKTLQSLFVAHNSMAGESMKIAVWVQELSSEILMRYCKQLQKHIVPDHCGAFPVAQHIGQSKVINAI